MLVLAAFGFGGPKDHINIGISHSGSQAQYTGDTRKRVL